MKPTQILIKRMLLLTCLLVMLCISFPMRACGQDIEIPSSFNPVGSGARALGMGGAFIAVADDATAASWNPGGLIQLDYPEMSVVVTSWLHRKEDIDFGTHPEAAGAHSISESDINYLSAVYPFEIANRNMNIALSYQHLYDFNRHWNFTLKEESPDILSEDHWDYEQEGRLTALGLSYCVQASLNLSVGVTLNLWRDGLTDNRWQQHYQMEGSALLMSVMPVDKAYLRTDEYSFRGVNANVGMLWFVNPKMTLGAVLKTPFTADVEPKKQISYPLEAETSNAVYSEEIDMPMSYGIGMVYKFSDVFYLSADLYRTEWDDFVLRDEQGNETCPLSGSPVEQSDVDPTHQIRLGAEYVLIYRGFGLVPLRAGIFYDPAPAEGSPDDIYGFSLGSGFTKDDWFSLDIAYQYRFGNDTGRSMLEEFEFSQDIQEHRVYVSLIWYKF